MSSNTNLDKRARALINRYLDGNESFDLAAQKLADIIREENARAAPIPPPVRSPDGKLLMTTPSLGAFIRSQTPETRAKSEIPSTEPGPSRDEDERVGRLMEEAWRLVLEDFK
jgi:hypothetical protein